MIEQCFPLGEVGPFLLISIVLVAGSVGGALARIVRLPGITGNILIGVLVGYCLKTPGGESPLHRLQPLSMLAMGLITVNIGGRLCYRRIHNAIKRIGIIALMEVIGTVVLVFFVARMFDADWDTALLLAAISAATAPGTIVALINENRGKGSFVKTLVSVVALDNILCIFLFAVARNLISSYYQNEGASVRFDIALLISVMQLAASAVIGLSAGKATQILVSSPRFHKFSTVLVAILLCTGVSSYLGLSPLLTCLFFGIFLGNSRQAEEYLNVLEPLEPLLYTCFFTLAGVSLHLNAFTDATVVKLCVAYLLARFAGKAIGSVAGGIITRCSKRIWLNIPTALVPQAGVAIGLVVLIETDQHIPRHIASYIGAIVLAAVTINEIIGPLLVRMSLVRAGEVDMDRPMLMEFMSEEFIMTDLQADDKWDAIRQLVEFLHRTHDVEGVTVDELYESVLKREESMTTALGDGVAIPHGQVPEGEDIQGVLGICREGIPFEAADGKDVNIIMLIVTPKEHEERHVWVMAALCAMVSNKTLQKRLTAAIDPHDVWEIIRTQEPHNYNYFLEED
ncbi:MAG: PTS transporter subunit EIIA [bacterium]|nr:PTS transporter subunit EIIA [bacterium]